MSSNLTASANTPFQAVFFRLNPHKKFLILLKSSIYTVSYHVIWSHCFMWGRMWLMWGRWVGHAKNRKKTGGA